MSSRDIWAYYARIYVCVETSFFFGFPFGEIKKKTKGGWSARSSEFDSPIRLSKALRDAANGQRIEANSRPNDK